MTTTTVCTAPGRPATRNRLADPGRSSSWSSAQTWRWLSSYERERVECFGLYLNLLERPGRPAGAA